MAETPDLGFILAQQAQILDEVRIHRESNQELARTLRGLTDTLVSIGRTMSGLDRRISEVKDDLETTIRMELVGHRNVTEDIIDERLTDRERTLVNRMTKVFDDRYAPKEKV